MNIAPADVSLPDLSDPDRIALFLDFDGTLVAIAERPEDVRLDEATRDAIAALDRLLGGALAIITGREIAAVDRFLAPLHLSIAGVHGLTRRDAQGRTREFVVDAGLAERIEQAVAGLIGTYPGLLMERKYGAVALHYRAHPELEDVCIDVMERAVAGSPNAELRRGKMVIEAKARGASKGTAVAEFMSEPPFIGRRPVFAGDDTTDEDAFVEVNARGGISIKIGVGDTGAMHRAAGTDEFLAWLRRLPAVLTR